MHAWALKSHSGGSQGPLPQFPHAPRPLCVFGGIRTFLPVDHDHTVLLLRNTLQPSCTLLSLQGSLQPSAVSLRQQRDAPLSTPMSLLSGLACALAERLPSAFWD